MSNRYIKGEQFRLGRTTMLATERLVIDTNSRKQHIAAVKALFAEERKGKQPNAKD